MSEIVLPTLSGRGWLRVSQVQETVDQLMADFFSSDALQSYLYTNQVSNAQYVIAQSQNDPGALTKTLGDAIERYFSRYYPGTVAKITQTAATGADGVTGGVELTLAVQFIYNGETYTVGSLVNYVDSKFTKVTKLNNTGTSS